MALVKRSVTVTVVHPDEQTPCEGTVRYKPGAGPLIDPVDGQILAGSTPDLTLDNTGSATISLTTTDQAGIQPEPSTWNWTIEFELKDATLAPFSFALPTGDGSPLNLATVARVAPAPGTYLVIPGPAGPKGDKGDPGDVGGGALIASNNLTDLPDKPAARTALGLSTAATHPATDFDTAGAATAAAATAQTAAINAAAADATSKAGTAQANAISSAAIDATNKVAAHTAAADPHGDRAYADNGDSTTLATAKAYTDAHSGGGSGGASIVSQGDDRIDIGIVTLTNTQTWAIVRSSGGTAIGKSVKAAVGDRILVSPSFMYTGTQYELDLAVMAADGTSVTRYASSSGANSTPGAEGYAPLYTQATSFPHITGPIQFTVATGEVDGSGNFTVNLAYFAPSLSGTDQKIYAGSGYIARMVMLNIGPEPA